MAQIYYLYGGYWKAKMASPRVVGGADIPEHQPNPHIGVCRH